MTSQATPLPKLSQSFLEHMGLMELPTGVPLATVTILPCSILTQSSLRGALFIKPPISNLSSKKRGLLEKEGRDRRWNRGLSYTTFDVPREAIIQVKRKLLCALAVGGLAACILAVASHFYAQSYDARATYAPMPTIPVDLVENAPSMPLSLRISRSVTMAILK